MSRILVLFDTKNDASNALDQLYQVSSDIDVRVHEYPGSEQSNIGAIPRTPNMDAGSPAMFVPVTGWLGEVGLNGDEKEYFVNSMRGDSSLVVVETEDEYDEEVHAIAKRYNGLIYQDR